MSYTKRGVDWEKRNSRWVVCALIPPVSWAAFFYIGYKVKEPKWITFGWAYLLVMAVAILLNNFYFFPFYLLRNIAYTALGLFWIGAIVYAFIIRGDYLRRLDYQTSGDGWGDDAVRQARNRAAEEFRRKHGVPNNPYGKAYTAPTPPPGGASGPQWGTYQQQASHYSAARMGVVMKEKVIKSAIPIYLVALVWVLYALLLPMYRMSDYLILLAVSVVVYLVARKLIPGKKILVEEPYVAPKTGNDEVDQFIEEGQRYLTRLHKVNLDIPDPMISSQIDYMESLSEKIFDFIAKNPSKANRIRKFMNYYLPTTLRLLESYSNMLRQGVQGENINTTMKRIESILDTIVKAFEKQLDYLFRDEAMDVSADITVLENMLASEGLSSSGTKPNDNK